MKYIKSLGAGVLAVALAGSSGVSWAKDIVIAQVAPFGGPLAVSGRDFNLGAMIAFDEINAAGGIAGHRIRLVSRDDGYRSAETVRLVEQVLHAENPVALIGMWGAENVEALSAKGLLEKSSIALVGVRSGIAALRKNPSIFHLRASYKDEIARILEQIETMGSTRIAVVYEDDGFGREALADVEVALAKKGLKPVAVAAQKRNDLQAEVAVQGIVAAQPQAVVLATNTPVAGAVIKALRARSLPAFIFTTSTVDAEQLVTQLKGAASGVAVAQAVPNPYKATALIAMEFQRRIKALGIDAERANFASLEGYIVARVVGEALRRSPGKEAPSRKSVIRGLESLDRTDFGGFLVDFGVGRREGSRYVDLSMVTSDGRIRQ